MRSIKKYMVEMGGVELSSKTPIDKGLFIAKLKLYTQLYTQIKLVDIYYQSTIKLDRYVI